LVNILKSFRREGAWKLTLVGGEPTLFPKLDELVTVASNIGYSFIRINTNGIFDPQLLNRPKIRRVNIICFSIDGATPEVNDKIRVGGSLNTVLRNMVYAKKLGYDVRVNFTVTSWNIKQVLEAIYLAQNHGASQIDFNLVFMRGEAEKNPYLRVNPGEWLRVYNAVLQNHKKFKIRVKIPKAFSLPVELDEHEKKGHRCIALEQSRVYVLPNGEAWPCVLFLGIPKYRTQAFKEEMNYFDLTLKAKKGCGYLNSQYLPYIPLCIYYKDRVNYNTGGNLVWSA
jgi:MoaA/NifB/PqqE/SkfB family radical SAM enzyme